MKKFLKQRERISGKSMKLLALITEEGAPGCQVGHGSHVCQMQSKDHEDESLIPRAGVLRQFKKSITKYCILSREHPATREYIKSSASILHEIERHVKYHPYTVHPFSEANSHWNIFMAIFTLISLISVPFIITFHFGHEQDYLYLLLFFNLVFLFDTIMNFFVGHFDSTTRSVILERHIIIHKYLKTFFIMDFLSGFPFELIYIAGSLLRLLGEFKWYWTVANILKIIRIRNLVASTRAICYLCRVSFGKCRILEMTIIVILCIHWASCLELYIPLIVQRISGDNTSHLLWLPLRNTLKNPDTVFRRYVMSANRATIALMSSTHYLPVKTTEDIILNLFLTVLGKIGFIYILAQFLQLMTIFHSTIRKNIRDIQEFHGYMKYKELPHNIRHRLLLYYKYYQQNMDKDKFIISQVSPNLRQELLLHNHAEMLVKIELLKCLPPPILSQVVMLIKNEMYLPDDTIVKHGTTGDSLYYIRHGTVSIINNNDKRVCQLKRGSYFGEASLVIESESHLITAKAVGICELSVIKRTDFLTLISPHENLLNRLQKLGLKKLDKPVKII